MSYLSWDDMIDIERTSMISRRSTNSEWEDQADMSDFLALKYGSDCNTVKSTGSRDKKPQEKDDTTRGE